MVDMAVIERRTGPWTRAEMDALPDDGRRHELLDGVLVVTPAPGFAHQSVLGRLYMALVTACPSELRVILAPFDVALAESTVVEPDLLVAPLTSFTSKDLPGPPLLAIEILSPSNKGYDLVDKWEVYEREGIASYWIVDPVAATLVAWELRDGAYTEIARVSGEEPFEARLPFPVTVVPAELTTP